MSANPTGIDARSDAVVAEAEAERPARALSGPVAIAVSAVAAALSAYALWNVFFPIAVLRYRIIFLAVVLSPTLFGLFAIPANAVLHLIHATLAVVSLGIGYMARSSVATVR